MPESQWTVQYYQRVLARDPIAYWMLDEKSGTVAYDLVSGRVAGAQNGTHSASVAHWGDGIGDQRTSSLYDPKGSYTDIYSATLNGSFSGSEGSLLVWARVSGAGVWTDGIRRDILFIGATGVLSFIRITKDLANNSLSWVYFAAVTEDTVTMPGATSTDMMCLGFTWSATGDVVWAYYNGAPVGSSTVLGAWAGALLNGFVCIGATNTVPLNPMDGWIAHCALWNRVLSPEAMADLAIVE